MNTPNWIEYCMPTIWFVLPFSYYNYDCCLECKIVLFYFSICLQGTRTRHSIHIAKLLQRSISTLFCESLILLSSHRQSHYWVGSFDFLLIYFKYRFTMRSRLHSLFMFLYLFIIFFNSFWFWCLFFFLQIFISNGLGVNVNFLI